MNFYPLACCLHQQENGATHFWSNGGSMCTHAHRNRWNLLEQLTMLRQNQTMKLMTAKKKKKRCHGHCDAPSSCLFYKGRWMCQNISTSPNHKILSFKPRKNPFTDKLLLSHLPPPLCVLQHVTFLNINLLNCTKAQRYIAYASSSASFIKPFGVSFCL